MEHIPDTPLLHFSGKLIPQEEALKNIRTIAYYFAASWCAPCKSLLPGLKKLYKVNKKRRGHLEIIYVSSDADAKLGMADFKERHGPWYAAPFDYKTPAFLRMVYDVRHIPIIIVTTREGEIISRSGTLDLEIYGLNVLVAWNCL